MKQILENSVNVISGLVQKHIIINNKINKNVLNQQNYQDLNNRLDNLQKLINSNNSNNNSNNISFYKCTSVNTTTKTWTGYELYQREDGMYELSTEVSSLSYTSTIPLVGKIYSEDGVIEVAYIPIDTGIPEDNIIIYIIGDAVSDSSGNGLSASNFADRISLTEYNGFKCFFTSKTDAKISVDGPDQYGFYPGNSRSYSMRICIPEAPTENVTYQLFETYINGGRDTSYDYMYLTYDSSTGNWHLHFNGYGCSSSVQIEVTYNEWLQVGVSIDPGNVVFSLYFNGIKMTENKEPYSDWDYNVYVTGTIVAGSNTQGEQGFRNGYFCKFRMYKDVLTANEMQALAKEV